MVPQEPEEGLNNRPETEEAAIEDIETLKKALDEEKKKAESYLANWQRAQADYMNFKRRTEQEKDETIKYACSSLVCSLLPILDDFERAFDAVPEELAGHSWLEGIRLVERKLRNGLEAQGLSPMKAVGEPFDPRLHEAVTRGKGPEGINIKELEKGYKFRDRVIRPSKVVVGSGEEDNAEAAQSNNEA